MDDPLLDQFQRSFSRGAENVAAALASTTAFVSAKRRESFLSHMFPSVTDAQKRKLLSDPLFDQKDLFAPASIEAAAKRQGISPCTGEPNLALPRRLAHIRGDSSAHPTPGAVTMRLLGPHHIAPRLHLLLQGASSRRRNPPIPPGNVGVFGSRSLSPCPA